MFYWLKIDLLDFKLQLHISALGAALKPMQQLKD